MEFVVNNLDETAAVAENLAAKVLPRPKGATVLGLYGELGAGKTTFMKYFAKAFGVYEEIQSPTYVIERIYDIPPTKGDKDPKFKKLIHIDAYRLESANELVKLGWNTIVSNPENLICIEWPELVMNVLPDHLKIMLEHVDENTRKIKVV